MLLCFCTSNGLCILTRPCGVTIIDIRLRQPCFNAIAVHQVLVVPILAGLSGRGVKPLTWASCIVALVGVGLLEQGGAPPGVGDVWNLLSALFFGLQVFELKFLTIDYTSN